MRFIPACCTALGPSMLFCMQWYKKSTSPVSRRAALHEKPHGWQLRHS